MHDALSDLERSHLRPAKTQADLAHFCRLSKRETERLIFVRLHHEAGTNCLPTMRIEHHRLDQPAGGKAALPHFQPHRNRTHLSHDGAAVAMEPEERLGADATRR